MRQQSQFMQILMLIESRRCNNVQLVKVIFEKYVFSIKGKAKDATQVDKYIEFLNQEVSVNLMSLDFSHDKDFPVKFVAKGVVNA